MNQQLLLARYQTHKDQGLLALKKGCRADARQHLLKAAEMLYKLAACAEGELREARKRNASDLLNKASSIRARPTERQSRRVMAEENGQLNGHDPAQEWIVTDIPDIRWDDVAGLRDVKALIRRRVIYPFQHPELTRKYRKKAGGGVLLYGAPGIGKTMIAKAIANEISAPFFMVTCSDIMSKWVGQAERNMRALFQAAREHTPSVIFMDEAEAIVSSRSTHSTVMKRLIPEFLAQVDGLNSREHGVLLLGATNRPWDMDEAALRPGRFDELIYVPLPDFAARRQIITSCFEGIPLAEDIDYDEIARKTEGYSGADLARGLCEKATDAPYERNIATGLPQRLELSDITQALEEVRPSVKPSMVSKYENFHM